MAQSRATMDALPPELLSQVFSFLDSTPPSDSRLHDQPKRDMFKTRETDLRNVTLVSRQWRAVVLPRLFRHASWTLDRWALPLVEPGDASKSPEEFPFLRFLNYNNLGRHVDTLVIRMENSRKGMTRRAEIGRVLDQAGSNSAGDGSETEDTPIFTNERPIHKPGNPKIVNRWALYSEDIGWFWELVFATVDPRRITLVASPQTLASVLGRAIYLGDAWSFSHDLINILSLSQETRSKTAPSAPKTAVQTGDTSSAASGFQDPSALPPATMEGLRNVPSGKPNVLFTIRPWTHLLLNEGPSTRVYRNYEFYLRRPPSILGALLGGQAAPNDKTLIPPTVKSFAYVAIFPLSAHFVTLINNLPRVDRLFVQLVPRNNILRDPYEMRQVQSADLWMERNSCYGHIMQELMVNRGEPLQDEEPAPSNWRHLRVFESGDSADREAWEMAVQYLSADTTGWRVERDGVFVRGSPEPSAPPPTTENTENIEEEDLDAESTEILLVAPETFSPCHRDLERIAFSGVENLPFPPSRTHDGQYYGEIASRLPTWADQSFHGLGSWTNATTAGWLNEVEDGVEDSWLHMAAAQNPEYENAPAWTATVYGAYE
ncbi:hypothetical protein OQA88_13357 [Cercophora sp. LCS_1]